MIVPLIIFFDLDGTLLNHALAERLGAKAFLLRHRNLFKFTEQEFVQIWQEIAEKHMLRCLSNEISFTQQRRARMHELFSYVQCQLSDSEADTEFEFYLQHYEKNWQLFDDVLPCLEKLPGGRLGIISNGNPAQQLKKLDKLGLASRFDYIVTSQEVGVAKPDAAIFLEACRRTGRTPQECLYVGDQLLTDAIGSRNAGLHGVWLNRQRSGCHRDVTMICSLVELDLLLHRPVLMMEEPYT